MHKFYNIDFLKNQKNDDKKLKFGKRNNFFRVLAKLPK